MAKTKTEKKKATTSTPTKPSEPASPEDSTGRSELHLEADLAPAEDLEAVQPESDFSALLEPEVDEEDLVPEAPAPEPEPVVAEGEATQEPVTEPEPEVAKPVAEPEPEPEPTKQPEREEPPAPVVVEEKTPEQQQQEFVEWRGKAEEALASHYALSEEEAEAVRLDPGVALPKLAAKLHLDVTLAAGNAIMQQLPHLMAQQSAQQSQNSANEVEFFDMWPKLKDKKHLETLTRLGLAHRQAHPNATREEFMRDVGASTMVVQRIPFDAPASAPVEAALPPAKLVAAAGGAPAQVSTKTNPFASFVEDVLEDERQLG